MSRERRLGRGLEALLGRSLEANQDSIDAEQPASAEPMQTSDRPVLVVRNPDDEIEDGIAAEADATDDPITRDAEGQQWLRLDLIDRNPYQPRQSFDEAEIADLCDSIRSHGFLQPIVVRPEADRYQLIAGERRMRAAQLASWERVPVQVRQVDDRQVAELAIVENVQRKDLNAIEKAASFQRYLQEYGCTQEELAERVSVDRSTVANLIRLLELPESVKQMVVEGAISQGHARALLPLGDEAEQESFAKRVAEDSLSVRATEQAVQEHIRQADADPLSLVGADEATVARKAAANQLAHVEESLRLALGTKVDLRQTSKGSGRITIHFKNAEEFERLRDQIGGDAALEAA